MVDHYPLFEFLCDSGFRLHAAKLILCKNVHHNQGRSQDFGERGAIIDERGHRAPKSKEVEVRHRLTFY